MMHTRRVSTPTHSLFHPRQTASVAGQFDVLSKQELRDYGAFAAVLSKNFEFPIFGGWTLELSFNKPVFECVEVDVNAQK